MDESKFPQTADDAFAVANTPPPGTEATFEAGFDASGSVAGLLDASTWKKIFDGIKIAAEVARKIEPAADIFMPAIAAQVINQILKAIPLPGSAQA